ncbi:hypothetical protein XO10_04110 [Marinitoga sp. 1135]|uniref:Uncharacterized protein n=1 Tax=Marinitoga piezophila (strain DSM 14283 / JCM 11233 / KA3) TaxID=443254 RepID=H2J6Y0_MARPK|nr:MULTISPECIES: hypothetical protein [Marinitoga]AEX85245.1 hypothetical protein Marpi_0828 [Marinitoga piezophila KA3]APT75733.1 hypothetical protein LN42_04585 [Marinitoga sp. 1137]NUU95474.1 hypothetical protein [Marinitoga sp. 1135]NUU97402.1 hypothetical protein [Marinitoga sp. 1138]
MKKIGFFSIFILSLLFIFSSCLDRTQILNNENDTNTDDIVLLDWKDWSVAEGHYLSPLKVFTFDSTAILNFNFELTHWDGDYGLEFYVLTEDDFDNLYYDKSFNYVLHKIFYTENNYTFSGEIPEGSYVFVIDNARGGDEQPDNDDENDYATFNLYVTQNK